MLTTKYLKLMLKSEIYLAQRGVLAQPYSTYNYATRSGQSQTVTSGPKTEPQLQLHCSFLYCLNFLASIH